MKKVEENDFPVIAEIYNTSGKRAANAYIQEAFGIKNPWSVIDRIRKNAGYKFNEAENCFLIKQAPDDEKIFMSMEELCGNGSLATSEKKANPNENTSCVSMEKLIHELISDRLLELSKYVTLEAANRTILIDRTSMIAAGYKIVTH